VRDEILSKFHLNFWKFKTKSEKIMKNLNKNQILMVNGGINPLALPLVAVYIGKVAAEK